MDSDSDVRCLSLDHKNIGGMSFSEKEVRKHPKAKSIPSA
jgi:hypothetical protein